MEKAPIYSLDKIFKLKVTAIRSMFMSRCCTPTPPNQCLYQVSTSYTLRFSEIQPRQTFSHQNPDTMGENNTLKMNWCHLTLPPSQKLYITLSCTL